MSSWLEEIWLSFCSLRFPCGFEPHSVVYNKARPKFPSDSLWRLWLTTSPTIRQPFGNHRVLWHHATRRHRDIRPDTLARWKVVFGEKGHVFGNCRQPQGGTNFGAIGRY
ncbi:hypothetical protein RRG08_050245 [Elysia crispata]|uniref:Uncharacterized protein n=1 Tax=Elysia crispata TaxID=231223 RepID=A0AAE1B4R1_9GAST|nr:hypothetical protein RRG08_050245 [Elysia crispata]